MKTKLHELLRWVLAPILAACLLAWFVTPAYPKDTKPKVPVTAQTAGPQPGASTDTQEIRKLIDELQARERENYTMVLEGQRKIVDWWISFLDHCDTSYRWRLHSLSDGAQGQGIDRTGQSPDRANAG